MVGQQLKTLSGVFASSRVPWAVTAALAGLISRVEPDENKSLATLTPDITMEGTRASAMLEADGETVLLTVCEDCFGPNHVDREVQFRLAYHDVKAKGAGELGELLVW